MISNSSLDGSGGAHSSYMEESKFLKRNRVLYFARLGLSFSIFGVAIAVVACEAPPLRHYKNTSQWASAGLALWPLNFDLRPTTAAISCGCIITILNLVYIALTLLPSPHSGIKSLNNYASASAVAGFVTALAGILFIIYPPSSDYPAGFNKKETLHSWTCKWKNGTSSINTPRHFDRDCINTRAGFVLLCVLVGMEVLMGLVAAVGTWFQRDISRHRAEQFQLEKLEIATKQVYRN
ncbi:hypothetical protein DTO013E5_8227 [Penicillium roqueforti]|uniref:uncharacterized protein n=1 Tax=Penicillium roqueforti TaxID=5082 RepID=UPI001909EAC5|nr:uncharacterized protein LCP9604111_3878 [Penicillium roqueforti]KAF9249778.1 hypothetical protein LCP9604111_3878 [Penicillium roqueforti]KAI1829866.1 hypothetical protein CBS147337_9373 [Penicillium roqueforti]KAI2669913.1 hypothetical protein CBS147355_9643 [Penicillium roqueforti]KAI2685000.1 hypothetical protein LCP963914a_5092 [Penicillium roqueforti]KAI2697232.1 hypothetical protein CBS147372_7970 [Penicillium roqueforti]